MQSNEKLVASILLQVWVDGKLLLTDDTARIRQKLTEFLDEDAETALRFRRKFELPVVEFQVPKIVEGNGNRPEDHMWNYQTNKDTCER